MCDQTGHAKLTPPNRSLCILFPVERRGRKDKREKKDKRVRKEKEPRRSRHSSKEAGLDSLDAEADTPPRSPAKRYWDSSSLLLTYVAAVSSTLAAACCGHRPNGSGALSRVPI